MKALDTAGHALKNLFTRGPFFVPLFKLSFILGFPLLMAYQDFHYGNPVLDYMKSQKEWIKFEQVNLFILFWLREMVEVSIEYNPEILVSKPIERNYMYCVVLLFIWIRHITNYHSVGGHGPDLYLMFYDLIYLGYLVTGIMLALNALKRKRTFLMLLVVTLAAGSFPVLNYYN